MLFIVPEKPLWRGINKVCMYVCLVKVKKTLQKPCTNNLAQRRIQKDRDQSK